MLSGYLNGDEDYWTHVRCDGDPDVPSFAHFCGLDLHNNTQNVWTENGTYSARLFAKRAAKIAANHNPNEVKSYRRRKAKYLILLKLICKTRYLYREMENDVPVS